MGRGCYYASPFIRDLQNCPELLEMFERIVGQPLLPYFCFSNSPQVNLSSPGSTAPVDHWHNDSIAFAGVVVLSDMEVVVLLVVFNKKNRVIVNNAISRWYCFGL